MNKSPNSQYQQASVSLNLIIILAIILTLMGMGLLSSTLDTINQGKLFLDYNYAELDANTCFEEAVSQIKRNPLYEGTQTITTDSNGNYCIYVVADDTVVSTQHQIEIFSKYNLTYYSEKRLVDSATDPITIIK